MNSLITGLESIAPRLGITLMHSLWQGAVVAIALAAILRLLRNAVVRYAVCCWAMVLFVALVALTFLVLAPAQPQVFTVAQTQAALSPMNFTIVSPAQKTSPVPVEPIDPMRWAGIVWLLGALVVAMWHLAGWLWIRRCVQGRELNPQPMLSTLAEALGIHRTIRLIETSRLNVPAVVGVFRPVILLPLGLMNDLPPEQIEAILIHELAHIRRHDYLVNLLQVVVESLLFYHPAMWWISSQIRREREHCCDDIAASRFTAGRYVSALLALEQRRSPRFHAAVAATGGTLLERAWRLLGREADANRRPFRSAVAALIVLACVVVPVVVVGCKKQPSATSSARASSPAAVAEVEPQASGITDEDLKPDYSVARLGPNDLVQVSVMELMGQGMESKEPRRISDPEGPF
jgi:beta-lactamase regulating signal transducer with metallopeptidase domain